MDQDFLNSKTREELLQICEERNINGMEKQPKEILVSIILNDLKETNKFPTREELEKKSITELRELLADMGIDGIERQPKPILVEILVNEYTRSVLSDVEATVVIHKEGEKVDSKITISCGGSQNDFNVVGYSINQVIILLREVLNIPDNPIAILNGSNIDNFEYILQDGDRLDFVQKAEKKGNRIIKKSLYLYV